MKRSIIMILMLCLLGLPAVHALELGQAPGPVRFTTLVDYPRTMDNYGRRVATVVVFMNTRSAAVREQIEEISAVYERYRLDEVLFVGVAPDTSEDAEEIRLFSQRMGLRFPIYRDLDGSVVKTFGASVTPEFFLLDRTGKLVYKGGLTYLEAAIRLVQAGGVVAVGETEAAGTPIGVSGDAAPVADPYGTMYFASQLIFREIPQVPVHHCPTVAEAANGDILCLWYAGSYESSEDQALYLSRRNKDACCWTAPERVLVDHEAPPGNAVIFLRPDGRVSIIWGRMEGSRPVRRGSGWGECRLFERISEDHGVTWGEDVEIAGSLGWLPRNVPVTLDNGEFVLPVSGRVEGGYGSFLLVLGQDGTWVRRGFIPGGSQPTIAQRENGEILCLMRHQRRILQSVSADNGKTWSEPELSELKNPGSGIAMTRMDGGRFVVAFNDTDQSDRTPFNLIQSTDGGKTWKQMKTLEADWGEFSYPSIIQGSDGMAHLVYTYRRFSIKHSTFDEGWLTLLERPN